MNDYYSLLGVRRDASLSEITMIYRRILKEKFQEAGYDFLFTDITKAYRTLSNENKRKEYDLLLQKVVGKYLLQNPNNPTPADKKFQSGLNAIDQKNFQSAVDYFTQAIKIDPEKSHFYSQLGLALGMFNGRLAEAERYCKKAIELEPDNPELCYNLGFLYQRHNLVDAAQQAFLQAQQAEQKRWANVFNQSDAVIELLWTEPEEEPALKPEEDEGGKSVDTDETSDKSDEISGIELAEKEETAIAFPKTPEETPTVDTPEVIELAEVEIETEEETLQSEKVLTAETIEGDNEGGAVSDELLEPIILNEGLNEPPSVPVPFPKIERKKATVSDAADERPEFLSTTEATDDQVILAEIIDGDPERNPDIENSKQHSIDQATVAEVSIAAMPSAETVKSQVAADLHLSEEKDVQPLISDYSGTVETVSALQSEDLELTATAASREEFKPEEDDILKDLASLEAELAEVEASSGIGSGDNGLLLEIKAQQDIVKYSPDDSVMSDRPWLNAETKDKHDNISLDDLEDEALNLLRELGLNPSAEEQEKAKEAEEHGQGTDDVSSDQDVSSPEDEEDRNDGEHEEELAKLEEMERKMAEELERLKQQRAKLKSKAKK